MNRTFGLIALAGFSLALAVHVAALFGIDVQTKVPAIWLLHVGIFVVFIPMVLQLRASGTDRRALLRGLPRTVLLIGGCLMLYALFNFLFAGSTFGQGTAEFENGQYILQYRGKLIRHLTEAQYHAHQAELLRGFSGHWLIFYFAALSHFLWRKT